MSDATPLPTMTAAPRVFAARVMHARLRPRANVFRYPVFFVTLPVAQLEAAANRWFSVNRWNLLSFHYRDYGPGDGRAPRAWLEPLLEAEGLRAASDGEIVLQTFPRVLGYVFNPVSFWYCHDAAGRIRAIVCEVNNTFGERHCYVLAHADARPIRAGETLAARKVFHVSPFFPIAGGYRFRFRVGAERTLARIDYHDTEGDLLRTSISGDGRPWSAGALLRITLAHGWMTVAIVARIHYQALVLAAKRIPFFRKPAPPTSARTRSVDSTLTPHS